MGCLLFLLAPVTGRRRGFIWHHDYNHGNIFPSSDLQTQLHQLIPPANALTAPSTAASSASAVPTPPVTLAPVPSSSASDGGGAGGGLGSPTVVAAMQQNYLQLLQQMTQLQQLQQQSEFSRAGQ